MLSLFVDLHVSAQIACASFKVRNTDLGYCSCFRPMPILLLYNSFNGTQYAALAKVAVCHF